MNRPRYIAVVGPTASGKSAVALELAKHCQGDIVCCDSVQLYRGFDIGSAKPSLQERSEVPHHLFDVFAWDESCDAAVYATIARQAIDKIVSQGRLPIVTGGTGLYLRALSNESWHADLPKDEALRAELSQLDSVELFAELQRLDARRAAQLHPNDRFRVIRALEIIRMTGQPVPVADQSLEQKRDHLVVVMNPERAKLHQAIAERTSRMLQQGLIAEVVQLQSQGVSLDCKAMQSIGYAEVASYLQGKLTRDELQPHIEAATRQYAKRQCTWFKKVPRDFTLSSPSELGAIVPQLIARLT